MTARYALAVDWLTHRLPCGPRFQGFAANRGILKSMRSTIQVLEDFARIASQRKSGAVLLLPFCSAPAQKPFNRFIVREIRQCDFKRCRERFPHMPRFFPIRFRRWRALMIQSQQAQEFRHR